MSDPSSSDTFGLPSTHSISSCSTHPQSTEANPDKPESPMSSSPTMSRPSFPPFTWPNQTMILTWTADRMATAAAITVLVPIFSALWRGSLPVGFTYRGIIGFGLMLGGSYNIFTSLMGYAQVEVVGRSRSDTRDMLSKAYIRDSRWGFAGLGMVGIGHHLLVRVPTLL